MTLTKETKAGDLSTSLRVPVADTQRDTEAFLRFRWVRQQMRAHVRTLLILLPLVLITAAVCGYAALPQVVTTDDCYLDAEKAAVATDIAGIVASVRVSEGQNVSAGDILYQLESLPYRLRVEHATAQLGAEAETIRALKQTYQQMIAQVKRAGYDSSYFEKELRRQQSLVGWNVASTQSLDAAQHAFDSAEQQAISLKRQLAAIASQLDDKPDLAVDQYPLFKAAMADLNEARRQLEHTSVRAHFPGVVTDVNAIAPGTYLQASERAFYLVSGTNIWVTALIKETDTTNLIPGMAASVSVDAYPEHTFRGTVVSVGAATADEFDLLPAENTTGNWVKVIQRVPVRIRLNVDTGLPGPLRAGMSSEVSIRTGRTNGLPHGARWIEALL